jgi:predicted Fe-S protein YdhL (DUF1289 family)
MTQPKINTPCIGVCTMADNGFCMGCFRSLDEITRWLAFNEEQRQAVMVQLESRMEAMFT